MRTRTIVGRLVIPAAIVLFVSLGLLAYFFVSAEASKARILTEYEADHLASSLLDAYRAGDLDDPAKVDGRVLAFGVYRPSSAAAVVYGAAPQTLDPAEARQPIRFDAAKGTLTLVRSLGMEPPRMPMLRSQNGGGMMMMGPGPGDGGFPGPGRFGPGRSGVLYLAMDVSSFYRTQKVYSVSMIAAPLLVAGLAAAFFLLLVSNTRYRRRAEERETMARLGESARTLAHEIRNPLGAIRIQTALLRRRLPADSLAEVAVIEEETERLNAISRRVGELLKDPRGSPETIPLPAFLDECAARAPFPVLLHAPIPACTVRFDRELFRSVIDNLVRNAWESYDGEPAEKPVEVGAALEGMHLSVSVFDRGKGVPPGMEEKVFDPFYTDKVQGSGLGLSLSRRLVRAAGGNLILLPRVGGGTEARILLIAGVAS